MSDLIKISKKDMCTVRNHFSFYDFSEQSSIENSSIVVEFNSEKVVTYSELHLGKSKKTFLSQRDKEMKRLNRKLKRRNAVFISEIPDLCRLILREYAWAKIESKKMFVHFGYDYYMYIGLEEQYEYVIDKVKYIGLFIEQMESPYK